jgi:hypothetical protein
MAPEQSRNRKTVARLNRPLAGGLRLLLAFAAGAVVAALIAVACWPALPASPGTTRAAVADPPGAPSATPGRATPISFEGQPGPWGVLEYTPISIAPPRDLIDVNGDITPTRWTFPGRSRAEAESLLREAGLEPAQLAALKDGWKLSPGRVTVTPDPAVILGLTPPVRAALYAVLARHPENVQNGAMAFNPRDLEQRLAGSGLAPASVDLFRRLLYQRGEVVFFADDRTLLPLLPTPDERMRMVLVLARQQTYAVRLRIDGKSDLQALLAYWGSPGRTKDIEPILSSLATVPGGYALDLAHLLPAIPRRRIYTYPRPGNSGDDSKNCHWTSLNFHSDTAADRLADVTAARNEVAAHYREVKQPAFGDLVLLVDGDSGTVVHSATYLADDLVFTKNGFGFAEPWMYMELGAMSELYSLMLGKPGSIKILLYRRRGSRV